MTAQTQPNPVLPSGHASAEPSSLPAMAEIVPLAPPTSIKLRRIQVESSLAGKLLRRWNFFSRYLLARAQLDVIRRFQPTIERFFEHEWLAGASVRLRLLPGEDRELRVPWPGGKYLLSLRWMPWRDQGSLANWSAPVTVAVYKNGKDGGRPEIVRYMSLFIRHRIVHIVQLQGVPLIEMPKGLRDWAERFVRATMEFARQEHFRGVWVARADSLYSYHNPTVRFLPPEIRQREANRIRTNMELHHNRTAIDLGFVPDEDWFKWQNPDCKAAEHRG
jgi:hypothetical protein